MAPRAALPPTVFFSSGSDLQSGALQALLGSAEIHTRGWDDLPTGPIIHALPEMLSSCDAAVAVIGDNLPVGLILDIGLALGAGLPVILIVEGRKTVETLPAILRELPIIVSGGSVDAISVRIAATIRSLVASKAADRSTVRSSAIPPASRHWADDSEKRVAEALQALGTSVIGESPANTKGRVDLAIWVPELSSIQLNPILVEVAGRRANLADKAAQLRDFMHDRHSLMGIVVAQGDYPAQWQVEREACILLIGINDLESLTSEQFVSLLFQGRNRLFHAR